MRTFHCLLILLPLTAILGAQPSGDAKSDASQLEGTWRITVAVRSGDKFVEKKGAEGKIVFKGNTITFLSDGEGEPDAKAIKLDPTKKQKQFDIANTLDPDMPVRGIYELNGDSLKLCFRSVGGERPTAFKSEAGSGCRLFFLTREKAKK